MYRDAKKVMRDRYFAVLEQAALQRAELMPHQIARLPAELRERLSAVTARMDPESMAPAAIEAAELALENHRRLADRAHRALRKLRKQDRDRALARRHKIWSGLSALLLMAAIWLPVHAFYIHEAEKGCKRSAACHAVGKCRADLWLACSKLTEEDCSSSESCRQYGYCSFAGNGCIARKDEDCAHSSACTEHGRCEASNGVCVLSKRGPLVCSWGQWEFARRF